MFSIIRCWNIRISCLDVSGKVIASLLAPLAFCKLHPAFGFKDAFFGPHPLLAVHFDFAMCALRLGTWRHFWHMFFFKLLQRPGQGRNVMLTLRGIVRFDPGQSCTKLFLQLIRNSFVINRCSDPHQKFATIGPASAGHIASHFLQFWQRVRDGCAFFTHRVGRVMAFFHFCVPGSWRKLAKNYIVVSLTAGF